MPDWRRRIRESFASSGHDPDIDVVEELNAHAEAAHEQAHTEGVPEDDAIALVERLVLGWSRDAAYLGHPDRRPPAPVPPSTDTGLLSGVAHDLGYAVRLHCRRPAFAIVAIITLTLGVAAVTTIWSVVHGVLLQPLPWPEADRIVRITETRAGRSARVRGTMMNGSYHAWAEQPQTIEMLAGWMRPTQWTMTTRGGEPVRITVVQITSTAFSVLGVQPLLGRTFREDEGGPGQPAVALISYGVWQEHYGGSADVVGNVLQVDGTPHTIVGVMDRGVAFPDRTVQAWTPFRIPGTVAANGAQVGVIFQAMARLRPGVEVKQAEAEATTRARSGPDASAVALAMFGAKGPVDVQVTPLKDSIVADVRPALLVLLASGGLLFAAAIANLASLQLARATARRRELAIRSALGAGRRRLARQLLADSILLSLCGGIGGSILAYTLCRLLPAWLPGDFPRQEAIAVDGSTLWLALALAAVAGLLCGAAPAWSLRQLKLTEALAEDGGAAGSSMRQSVARSRATIVAGQIATSCVMLVGAILLSRSFVSLARIDRGYDAAGVITAQLPFSLTDSFESRRRDVDALMVRLHRRPGVIQAAYSTSLPLLSVGGSVVYRMPSPSDAGVEIDAQALQRIVSAGYFSAMRLRVVGGRVLNENDGPSSPPVVVVNRSFAAKYLGPHPIGAYIPQKSPAGSRFLDVNTPIEVVGIVEDTWQDGIEFSGQPEMFSAFAQIDGTTMRAFQPFLIVRTANDPTSHLADLRRLVKEEVPTSPLESVMTMDERLANSLARPRLYATVLTMFAGFTVLLTAIGLFGMLAYTVAMRTREIGVRTAIGAQTRDVVWLVLRQALAVAASGIAIGLVVAWIASRYLGTVLYGVTPHDALTFATVAAIVLLVALAACVVPARRAARLSPLIALRHT